MSCNDDKTYEPCSCGCGGSSDCNCDCSECAPVNCIEQAIRDALATLQEQLEALVKRAEDAAKASEDAAAASAASAAEAKDYRDAAELAATTATDALKTITDVAVSLEETAKKLQEIADELATAIAGIAVVTWYYTAVSEGQTVIPVPDDKNALDVQCIYIEGVRQEPGYDRNFVFDKTAKTITLAEGIPLGLEISIILGTYSDNPTDFPHTLASTNGASLVGTTSGQTVQQSLDSIDDDLIKLKLNWAIENGYADSGLTFASGGTLTANDRNKVVYDPVSKTWYSWSGSLPYTITAGMNPVGVADWHPQIDPKLRSDLASDTGFGLIGGINYAGIRAYTGVHTRVYCIGKSNVFDGGFGIFEVDASDTTSADNGGTILVDANNRRWKRQYDGSVNLLWFAKGDGTTDDSAALQKAVNATKFGGRLDVPMPSVNYKISTECVISQPIDIVGNGGSSVTTTAFPGFKAAGHNNIFKLKATLNNYMFGTYGITGVHMRDLFLEGPSLSSKGFNGICTDETVNNGVYHFRNNTFTNVNMRYFDNGWNIRGVCYLNSWNDCRALWCANGCTVDKVSGATEGGSDQNRFFGCEFVLCDRGLSLSEEGYAGSQTIVGCTLSEGLVGLIVGFNTTLHVAGNQIENNQYSGINITIPSNIGNPASEGVKNIVGNCFILNGNDIVIDKKTTAFAGGFAFPVNIEGNTFSQTSGMVLYVNAPTGPGEFDSRQLRLSSSNAYSPLGGGTVGLIPDSKITSGWKGYNGYHEDGKVTATGRVIGDTPKNILRLDVPAGKQCYISYDMSSLPDNAASGSTPTSAGVRITNVTGSAVLAETVGNTGTLMIPRVTNTMTVVVALWSDNPSNAASATISYCMM